MEMVTYWFLVLLLVNKYLSTLKANGDFDIFVAKFAPDATIKWAKSISGSKSEYCNYITSDAKNEIYLTGGFEGSIVNNKARSQVLENLMLF